MWESRHETRTFDLDEIMEENTVNFLRNRRLFLAIAEGLPSAKVSQRSQDEQFERRALFSHAVRHPRPLGEPVVSLRFPHEIEELRVREAIPAAGRARDLDWGEFFFRTLSL